MKDDEFADALSRFLKAAGHFGDRDSWIVSVTGFDERNSRRWLNEGVIPNVTTWTHFTESVKQECAANPKALEALDHATTVWEACRRQRFGGRRRSTWDGLNLEGEKGVAAQSDRPSAVHRNMPDSNEGRGSRRALRVFLAYNKRDKYFRERLEVNLDYLRQEGKIEIWHDEMILAGEAWNPTIQSKLESADIVLFLLSNDLLASPFVEKEEIPLALARHHAGLCTVIPIFLRKVYAKDHPLMSLQGLPSKDRPIQGGSWVPEDDAFYEIARGLDQAIEAHWRKAKKPGPQEAANRSEKPSQTSVHLIAAPQDQAELELLKKHLTPFAEEGLFTLSCSPDNGFHELDRTSAERTQRIINSADLLVPLLSPNLLVHREFRDMIVPVIVNLHQKKDSFVIPVVIKGCFWQATPLADLPVVLNLRINSQQTPLTQDEAFLEVARKIVQFMIMAHPHGC